VPKNASNFTCSQLDFKKFSRRETPDSYLKGQGREGERKGLKGSYLSRNRREGKDRGVLRREGEKEG